ncbi:MAG: F0F1 ATP synthase subunit epsilon [Candidatus Latescibacteria bacterium]|jgi:F-type H+-transporting ATPase subunit epsilon|nr:F0F1 ATP synthase subunit epsilon [Candidatus Latescibacterota bacterium]
MATYQLDIVTPEKTVYSGEIEHFRAPGVDGSFGVLARHQPMLAALATGLVNFREAGGSERTLAISGGFANVSGDGATVLAETAEFGDEIDIDRARASRDRAQERLGNRAPEVDVERAQAALGRAILRLNISGGA